MDESQAVHTPRALWLALVAIALGIAWFLCGGASSASATNLLPDTPPVAAVADASVPVSTAPVPVAPALEAVEALLPAVPAAAVLPEIAAVPEARTQSLPVPIIVGETVSIAAEVVVAGLDARVTAGATAGAPIVATLVALAPAVALPAVALPAMTISAVALPAVSVPAATVPTESLVSGPPTSPARANADATPVDPAHGAPFATTDFASLTPADAAASAAGTPLGVPGQPVNLPQPTPVTASSGGTGAVSVLPHHASARAASIAAARLASEDDALPSSPATDPGSSPA
ncbi:hypothetical protein [Cryobacterium zhongshanensis]|uniref:Uncharacterized protein n=1 Tax=Cryobacterium zhongshanensis TaxID=2928153 RepID=A0AA41UFK1_9MICO|nr:hypothetical protein [Cryobacterium zhongshanensis]MCI4658207.1 hypothetical protein [Cryobacterium zhongshanensis]